ncbi:MAG: hypothetical protein M0R80_08525 [Proteobacteria bacterium]|jgi:hypothetical protein|nr:hypothetical protein [Pseudomonadota bacterium]
MAGLKYTQTGYRWYLDDHALGVGENPLADENTQAAGVTNTNYRIRIKLATATGGGSSLLTPSLYYSKPIDSPNYYAIGVATPVVVWRSDYITDSTGTGNSLLSPEGTYAGFGTQNDMDSVATQVNMTLNMYAEWVWSLKFTSIGTYAFKITNNSFDILGGYPSTPLIVIEAGSSSSSKSSSKSSSSSSSKSSSSNSSSSGGAAGSSSSSSSPIIIPIKPSLIEMNISTDKHYRTNEEPNALYKMQGIHHILFRDMGS